MSKAIYDALVSGGLSPVGACAVMGNMDAESNLISYRLQGDMQSGFQQSKQYTENVDSGAIGSEQFAKDQKGYGLCQWTYHSRKRELLAFAKEKGVSVGDEAMQCAFCIIELKRDYSDLYKALCGYGDMRDLVTRFCTKFERPAVNNIKPRLDAANEFFNQYCIPGAVGAINFKPSENANEPKAEQKKQGSVIDSILGLFGYRKTTSSTCDQKTWIALAKRMPNINRGCNSDAVKALQCMLNVCGAELHADGDWGDATESAFQKYKGGDL